MDEWTVSAHLFRGSTYSTCMQARQACQQAIKDSKTRMLLEIILPLIGATDLDDWPVRSIEIAASFSNCYHPLKEFLPSLASSSHSSLIICSSVRLSTVRMTLSPTQVALLLSRIDSRLGGRGCLRVFLQY